MSAIKQCMNLFISFLVQFSVICKSNHIAYNKGYGQTPTVAILCLICTLLALFGIFVHWRKGSNFWIKIAPKIYLSLLIAVFFLIPVVCVVILLKKYYTIGNYDWNHCTISFMVTSFVLRPLEFYFILWRTAVYEARFYI